MKIESHKINLPAKEKLSETIALVLCILMFLGFFLKVVFF